jgi:hypothetical protein
MTEIWNKFKEILLEKSGEKNYKIISEHLKNVIALRNNFNCNVYGLTSTSKKGFWNFSDKQILELKESKAKRGFVIVFLTAPVYGYLLYDNEIEQHSKDLPIVEGYYKVKEDYLRSINVHQFRTIDEFIDLLSPYQKQ